MLLQLKEIFVTEGESLNVAYQMDMSDVTVDGIYPFVSPIKVNLRVQNRAGLVLLNTDVSFLFAHPCDRCLEDITKEYDYSFEHILVVSAENENDEDYIEVPDYELNPDELVRADILLELPTKFLCREDCKGLCPKCGKNLNLGDCGCEKKLTDPRLEILKQLMN